jgi:hypothetical protein
MASIYFDPSDEVYTGESLTISIEDLDWSGSFDVSNDYYNVKVYADGTTYKQWQISSGAEWSVRSITVPSYECTITVELERYITGMGMFDYGGNSIYVVQSSSSGSGSGGSTSVYNPSIGTITLRPVNSSGVQMNYAVQGISKILVSVSGSSANDGYIYVVYDRERGNNMGSIEKVYACAREILTAKISESDIIKGSLESEGGFFKNVVSKLTRLADGDPNPYAG